MSSDSRVDPAGYVAPGFEGVRDAFAEAFARGREIGAAFAVTQDGRSVVDLWGGQADESAGRPWEENTVAVIFSGTKALVGICLLILVDRGQLDLKAPVCRYWPEFAAAGKEHVRVIELVSHRARLPGMLSPVREDEFTDGSWLATQLAGQPQDPDPRAGNAYHPFTYGWLCGELLRRVDGRSVGRFLAEEVAGPLGLDLWIGLPAELESRVASLRYASNYGQSPVWDPDQVARDGLLARVWHNPPVLAPAHLPWNRADWHRAEIPGAGAIATARSIARLYGFLAMGGEYEGKRLLSAETLARGRAQLTRRIDPLLQAPAAFAVGFELQTEPHPFGPPADAFGHTGAGGSVHCAWPSHRLGMSYVMNLMRDDAAVDPRPEALLDAVHAAVTGR
jgi:CubicO group peptidase (beta-lactamase class C family)